MIAITKKQIAILAMTKTGSTAIESALRPHCDVILSGGSGLKHMPLRKFNRHVRPIIENPAKPIETVSLFREPVSWLSSWYRYRRRPSIPDQRKSTHGISFESFVDAYIAEYQPIYAQVGRPAFFVKENNGTIGVDHLFRYEDFPSFTQFISARMGMQLRFARENMSPVSDIVISSELRTKIETAMAEEYEIYESLGS